MTNTEFQQFFKYTALSSATLPTGGGRGALLTGNQGFLLINFLAISLTIRR
jgi:hypothetical protein